MDPACGCKYMFIRVNSFISVHFHNRCCGWMAECTVRVDIGIVATLNQIIGGFRHTLTMITRNANFVGQRNLVLK